ncbi:MAPEG family protein [Caulobacter vibrioides]|uniref:MAPEG family protein n=2 Tax=Caulobacter vibrioides TaxID=155892 RepID=A0A0H3CC08_CAUVN|nr:MAPEG family protein [Caulobacter vibrioides]YP_002518383.1 MAPEG family protein [Caulobacter vibrioides NA1000]ACL96475.1 MAPEG family protein [Caulobacter vibrioides NA1000]ATC29747.1 MAPEG family protein [Caulobacter vibrioides]ATC30962.1 MAPEG family protein [Caulobacter vibrioides]QXZ51266.1 MAPEG family protein [Caulobacter vibrioides]
MQTSMVAPVMALVAWSLVIWLWMYVQRIPAMQKAGIKPQDARFPGSLDKLPDGARQAADNYNHLMEQPTIFYAAALAIQVAGHADGMAVHFAWVYVGLRVLHSLVQVSVNLVALRFLLFVLSTGVLAAMVIRELMRLF